MKTFEITYSNNYFNVICVEEINANNEDEAINNFEEKYKELSYIEFIEIKEVDENA